VHEVVQDGDLEDTEQLRLRLVPGELHGVVVRGDPGDEAEDTDQQEYRADDRGDGAYEGTGGSAPGDVGVTFTDHDDEPPFEASTKPQRRSCPGDDADKQA
jgi:hypothetical protein